MSFGLIQTGLTYYQTGLKPQLRSKIERNMHLEENKINTHVLIKML